MDGEDEDEGGGGEGEFGVQKDDGGVHRPRGNSGRRSGATPRARHLTQRSERCESLREKRHRHAGQHHLAGGAAALLFVWSKVDEPRFRTRLGSLIITVEFDCFELT